MRAAIRRAPAPTQSITRSHCMSRCCSRPCLPRPPHIPTQVRFAAAGAVPLLVKLLRAPKDATRRAAASGGQSVAATAEWGRQAATLRQVLVVVAACCAALLDLGVATTQKMDHLPATMRCYGTGPPQQLLTPPVTSHIPNLAFQTSHFSALQRCGTWPTATTPTARRLCGQGPSRPSCACSRSAGRLSEG